MRSRSGSRALEVARMSRMRSRSRSGPYSSFTGMSYSRSGRSRSGSRSGMSMSRSGSVRVMNADRASKEDNTGLIILLVLGWLLAIIFGGLFLWWFMADPLKDPKVAREVDWQLAEGGVSSIASLRKENEKLKKQVASLKKDGSVPCGADSECSWLSTTLPYALGIIFGLGTWYFTRNAWQSYLDTEVEEAKSLDVKKAILAEQQTCESEKLALKQKLREEHVANAGELEQRLSAQLKEQEDATGQCLSELKTKSDLVDATNTKLQAANKRADEAEQALANKPDKKCEVKLEKKITALKRTRHHDIKGADAAKCFPAYEVGDMVRWSHKDPNSWLGNTILHQGILTQNEEGECHVQQSSCKANELTQNCVIVDKKVGSDKTIVEERELTGDAERAKFNEQYKTWYKGGN